ncbi:hypothetical protein DIURU_005173 [Diutina rugosa]|uniref:F-box domain-containing protein n=1 Tax=Diutina rugosa TaxID=5481 RepID=A0A642UEI7_DIURU|nr:uncharacterized protein DIURU_005173 [Diutina rugosa]KAA8897574.1 hypothetical protein DIURU_005173 [Diutina rugosa]
MVASGVTFDDLPFEIQRHVFSLVDVPSVCRCYVAWAPSRGAAAAAADILATRVVPVSPTSLPGSEDDIDFSLLSQLPPCKVSVAVAYGRWQGVVNRLNLVPSFKSLDVAITGALDPLRGNFRLLRHPINDLSLSHLAIGDFDLPKTLKSLTVQACRASPSFIERLSHLETLVISGMEDPPVLPESLVDVTLPKDWELSLGAGELPYLTATNNGLNGGLRWHQVTKLTDYCIPDVPELPSLKHIVVKDRHGADTFTRCHCPNLETVWISPGLSLHPDNTDVRVLFTEPQMAKLTHLTAFDYHISDVTPFTSLRMVHMKLNQPLTQSLPLPPTLYGLSVDTTHPVEGVPPQITSLSVFHPQPDPQRHAVIDAPNVRRMSWSYSHNLTLHCPKLTDLTILSVTGKLAVEAPNLVSLAFSGFAQHYPLEKHPLLAKLSYTGTAWQHLVVPHRLRQLTLIEVEIHTLEVEAKHVWLEDTSISERAAIKADVVYSDTALVAAAHLLLECRVLEIPFIHPHSCGGVEHLILDTSDDYGGWIDTGFFTQFTRLTHINLQSPALDCSQQFPLVIPATVKSLVVADATTDELWLQFADETQLEYLEITHGDDADDAAAYYTQQTLGLTAMPPSFYCPRLRGGVSTS